MWIMDEAEKRNPVNTRHCTNVGLMLVQRRRRWANIKPTLGQCLVFAGKRVPASQEDMRSWASVDTIGKRLNSLQIVHLYERVYQPLYTRQIHPFISKGTTCYMQATRAGQMHVQQWKTL